MDLCEFDFDKRIDPEGLDVEAVKQPELIFKWSERAIDARDEADRLELSTDTLKAEIELKIRARPAKYNLPDKPTEAAIKAKLATHPLLVAAMDKLFDAKKNSALMAKAVAAMESKQKMIETLTKLHGQQYFSGPTSPRNLGHAVEQRDEAAKRVNKRQLLIVRKRNKS